MRRRSWTLTSSWTWTGSSRKGSTSGTPWPIVNSPRIKWRWVAVAAAVQGLLSYCLVFITLYTHLPVSTQSFFLYVMFGNLYTHLPISTHRSSFLYVMFANFYTLSNQYSQGIFFMLCLIVCTHTFHGYTYQEKAALGNQVEVWKWTARIAII